MSANLPPGGWYEDPERPGQKRFWDGYRWTDHRRGGAVVQDVIRKYPRRIVLGAAGISWLLGLSMGAIGGADTPSAAPLPATTVTDTVTSTVTAESTVTVTTTPSVAPTAAAAPAASLPAPATSTPTTVEVPDGTGMNYQQAQDLWRSAGLVVGVAIDATGANRLPFLDSNWLVLEQDIAAGSTVDTGTIITATVKKYTDN